MAYTQTEGSSGALAGKQTAANVKMSRVQSETERVLGFINMVNDTRESVARHASALGYFSECPAEKACGVAIPNSPNLQGALGQLGQAIDELRAELRRFD